MGEGSAQSAHMHRLVKAFVNKYAVIPYIHISLPRARNCMATTINFHLARYTQNRQYDRCSKYQVTLEAQEEPYIVLLAAYERFS